MVRTFATASLLVAGIFVSACSPKTEMAIPKVEPVVVFPDMPAPGPFNRAYTMTESPDGAIRVFAMESRDDTDIYETIKQEDGSWSEPQKLEFPKNKSNTNPSFSAFDGRLYFASDREIPGLEGRNDMNIWSVALTTDGWADAKPVPGDVNTGDNETSVATTAEGILFFDSKHPRGQGGQDIYMARYDADSGEWKTEFLPEQVNSPRVDSHVAAMPDGKTILFYSYRSPKLGVVDIFAASQKDDGDWTSPYNVGPLINTRGIDFGPGVSADGKTLFFSREGQLMALPTDTVNEELALARAAADAGTVEAFLGLTPVQN